MGRGMLHNGEHGGSAMSWERRGKGKQRYYCRSRRRPGGGIERTYFGRGPVAEQAARQDAETQARREADRAERCRIEAAFQPLDALNAELDEGLKLLAMATFMAGNLHQHNGQWRSRRGLNT